MSKARLNDLMKAAYETAKELINGGTSEPIMPVFILLDRKNKVHIIGTPFNDEKEKDMTAAFIREQAKELGATAYVHVSEAWVTTVSPSTPASDIVQPSKSEARREVLMVAGEDIDKGHIAHMWPIERDANNKRSLGPEDKDFPGGKNLGGRFANLLSE